MEVNVIIIDNFYTNPEEVREFALSQDFSVRGNYPGNRTVSFLDDELKDYINRIVSPHAGNVIYWADEGEETYTGAFQLTTAEDRTWIHADQTTGWAGVCYLTPNAHTLGVLVYLDIRKRECINHLEMNMAIELVTTMN